MSILRHLSGFSSTVLGYIDPGSGYVFVSFWSWLIVSLIGFSGLFLLFFKKIPGFVKKYKKITFILFIIVLGLIVIGLTMNKGISGFDKKVVILGFDGLDPAIVESMMGEGKLPNFSRLKEQGSYRRLSTTNPPQSPVAWAGFATGQNPGENGVFDFIIRDPETYGLKLSLSNIKNRKARRIIKSKCFWQYTSEAKIPTVIIGCPLTFPPDKIYGRMLSGMGVPDVLGTEGTFSLYTTEIADHGKDIGGNVFRIKKSKMMIMDFLGPKVAVPGGKAKNTKVPFKVTLEGARDKVMVEYQKTKIELKAGQWSGWSEVTFKLGLFGKMKGIFKLYLAEIDPEFRLYVSPINFDPRSPYFGISYPGIYSRKLAENIGLYYTQGMPIDTWAVNENRLGEGPLLEQANEVLREKKAMLDFELNRFEKGVLFCYFGSPDIIQHMFWRYTDPLHPLYEANAPQGYKEKIQDWYRKMDGIMGDVSENIGNNDVLIVMSDHGFNTFRRTVHVNSWLRKNNYLVLKNLQAESGSELLEDVDWSKTKAYAISFGGIYINQKGREKNGIVAPGKDTELLKKELSDRLKQWHDPEYNEPVVNTVYSREDIFRGRHAGETPDLYLGFNIGYRASWQTALGAAPKELIEDNLKKWSGDHLFDPVMVPGILFSNKRITKDAPSIYDITPTVLKTIGLGHKKLKKANLSGDPLF